MKNRRYRPLICAEVVYFLLFIAELTFSVLRSGHHLVYPLDDTYITMAMAKHFAQHGVWGVTPFAFTSATSTPLYVLLLSAAYCLAGVADWWPMLLAFLAGAAAIAVANGMLPKAKTPALLALVLFTPMATMAHIGMEHTLHCALTLLFAWRASAAISEPRRMDWLLILLTPALVMTRFEGLFLVGICALLLCIRRSFLLAIGILAAAIAPVAAYGMISLANGWFFLPNSLMLKGAKIGLSLLFRPFIVLCVAPHLLSILAALAFALWASKASPAWTRSRVLLWVSLLSLIAHVTLADVGWIFRYEAYLIALSVVSLATALPLIDSTKLRKIAYAIAAAALLLRSGRAFYEMPSITAGIYSQQYQMARFVERYYPGASVAANDIGAINYRTDLHLFDLVGLADPEVLRLKRRKAYTTAAIEAGAIERKVAIAIVYDSWFSDTRPAVFGGPSLPQSWVRVGRWRTAYGEHLGGDTVSFYAVRPEEENCLRQNLQDFRARP